MLKGIDVVCKKYALDAVIVLFVAVLVIKYFWTLVLFDLPLGYDVGIYRYLFLKHAAGWAPFQIPPMDLWAMEHPFGLFAIVGLLIKIGMPVDWFVGWIWNAMPVLLACVLAVVIGRRQGKGAGVAVLLVACLSLAQFHGFVAMYWKSIAALLTSVIAFYYLERTSWLAILFGMLTIAIHHQTGLLFALAVSSWILTVVIKEMRRGKVSQQTLLVTVGLSLAIIVLGFLWYLPQLAMVSQNVRLLLSSQGANAAAGSFPPGSFYLLYSGILLLFGVAGFIRSFRKEIGSLWQWSVLWAFAFVFLRLLFYRRFFLHLDFFLLPFAAMQIRDMWKEGTKLMRVAVVILLVIQSILTLHAVRPQWIPLCDMVRPLCRIAPVPPVRVEFSKGAVDDFAQWAAILPDDAYIMTLEPASAPWLRGWMTDEKVVGPGIFDAPWDQPRWEKFLLGTNADRKNLLQSLPSPTYIYLSQYFYQFYGARAAELEKDPCMQPLASMQLFRVLDECSAPGSY